MSNERKIAENIRKLIEAVGFDSILCTVVSVDDDVTCSVKSVESGVLYKNIKLNANIKSDKGIYVFPKKNSYVLATLTDGVQGFVSMYSEIEKVKIKIDDTVEVEIGGDTKIECKGNIEVNGGNNDGLVIVGKMVEWMQKVYNDLTTLETQLKGHSVTGDGAPLALVFNPTTPSPKISDFENKKIKH